MLLRLRLTLAFILIIHLTGCENEVLYDYNQPINCYGWKLGDTLVYEVKIKDIDKKYDISLNIRHRDVYEFMNIYLNIITLLPDNSVKQGVISVPLCDDGGQWYGRCTGDICFQRLYIMKKIVFPVPGKYIFKINHEMRVNELCNLFDLGVRVEQSKKKLYKET